jgi:hypothetical protein
MQVAIEDALLDVIADERQATQRQARQEARRQASEAEAALRRRRPLAPLKERLDEIEGKSGSSRRCTGGRETRWLIGTLELERAEIAIPRGGAARSMGDQPLIQVSA